MDIRKYFFGGPKPAKDAASPTVNKSSSATDSKEPNKNVKSKQIIENDDNNNNEKLPKKDVKINKDIPKPNDIKHEKSNHVEEKKVHKSNKSEEKKERKESGGKKESVKEKPESPKEVKKRHESSKEGKEKHENRKEKERERKPESPREKDVKKKHRSPSEKEEKKKHESPKETKKKNDEQKHRDKSKEKSSDKNSLNEDKVKDKSKSGAEKKPLEEENVDKKKPKKKAVIFDSDSDDNYAETKKKSKKKRVLSVSSDESEDMKITGSDSDEVSRRGKGGSSSKKRDQSMKKSQHKRKRPKSDSESDEEEDSDFEWSAKSSSRKKKIKKQKSSDEDSDDMNRRMKKKKSKGKKNSIQSSDSESEKEAKSKKKRRKARAVVNESDEEKGIKNFFKPMMANEKSQSASKPKKSPEDKAKDVSVSDFFGSSTVQRKERKAVSPVKRKISESFDDEFHDDDDFAATLELLDKQDAQVKKEEQVEDSEKPKLKTEKEASPQKKTGSPQKSGSGLAGKLAKKIKMEKEDPLSISPKKKEKEDPLKISPKKEKADVKSPSESAGLNKSQISTPDRSSFSTLNRSVDIPETPVDKTPSENRAAYRAFLNREGPRNLGSKEIPVGADNCLEGLTFVITGVLESIERDECKSLIERYGGKVTGSLSGRTSYIVIGRDAGESKLKKAESLKTTQLDEDGVFDLIRTKPGKKSKYLINAEKAAKEESSSKKQEKTQIKSESPPKPTKKSSPQKSSTEKSTPPPPPSSSSASINGSSSGPAKTKDSDGDNESILWVDKYKPKTLKQVIGQNGDKSNAKKLLNWLKNWQANRAAGVKPAPNRYFGGGGGNDTGAGMKAALLSGPPGVGKTTTADLVCRELGFSSVEMNASDTRSKSCLQSEVQTLLQNSSLLDFCGNGKSTSSTIKHCLIMDEVDGMAGNEDRGGVAELIQLIKSSKIPIICLCNDRQHPKIRSLVNYCFDLRFQRPRVEQIKAAMMTLAFKEGLKIAPPALDEVIVAANQDIRQIIHNLSMFTSTAKNLSYDDAKQNAQKAKKDIKMGPFDVCRQVFVGSEETRKMSLDDKSNLFFNDYQLTPLFVQENYPMVRPYAAGKGLTHHLSALARTAESICDGDLVEKLIRSQQNWGLLPMEAMYASVLPGEYMRGNVSHMVSFPKWLGKFSSRNKNDRILQELSSHMRLCISTDKRGLNMDYLPCLRHHLSKPLQELDKEGVPQVIQMMDEYDIIKEDYDNIMEITKWPNTIDYSKSLSSQTKAAFTRAYNKESHMTPYSTGALAKKRTKAVTADFFEDGEGEAVSEEDNDDIEVDSMIKKKKTEAKGKGTKGKESKGKETKGKETKGKEKDDKKTTKGKRGKKS